MFKKEVEKILKKHVKIKEISLEIPRDSKLGDYAFPCFNLAKTLKKSPVEIAKDLAKKIKPSSSFEKIEANGPYVNFFLNKGELSEIVIKQILKEKESYGVKKENKRIVIESPSPNTNKPLHLGHLRNMALGSSLGYTFKKLGNKVFNVDLINDRGVHICKSMVAYELWGKNKKPNKKSDHFVGDFYVLFSKKTKEKTNLDSLAQECLVKWEEGDKKTLALWKKMDSWVVSGIYQTYKEFGHKIDRIYRESEHYKKGRIIVKGGLKKGIFKKDKEGAIFVDLTKNGLDKKILLRADGTSVYMTQDIYLAKKRYSDFKMDKMVYIVGSEQIYHFKVLFEILKLLNYKFAKNCYHLAYGMIYLPEGKMKSREGTIVDADDIMAETIKLAEKEIKKRFPKLSKKEVLSRAKTIGLGALKFFLLKYDSMKDFTFNPQESLSFEGETGPYVQYAYARISAILRKSKGGSKINYSLLGHPKEAELVKLLSSYPNVVEESAKQYKPNLIAHHLIKLARAFNLFYQECPVLKTDQEVKKARLALILAVSYILKDGLSLLGISVLDRM